MAGPGAAGDDGVWPQNAAIVEAFLIVSTQWRAVAVPGGMAPGRIVWLGLDYAGVEAGLKAAGVAVTPELWLGLQVMEAGARDALNGIEA